MDVSRAQQIFNSRQSHQVLFNSSPIWIESLSADAQTAKVRQLDGSIMEVAIAELSES